MTTATLIAGIPAHNDTLYHRIRFAVGDPAACLELPEGRLLIVRDIEMDRARTQAHADRVACPADFTPEGGLDGDRETATAQAAAEALRQHGIQEVADRTWACSLSNNCVPPESRSGSIPIWVWLNADKKTPRSWKCSTSVNV